MGVRSAACPNAPEFQSAAWPCGLNSGLRFSTHMSTLVNTPAAWSDRANTAMTEHEACLWSERGQMLRLAVVAREINQRATGGERVLDYGCGTGRLVDLLDDSLDYVGYDWAPGMRDRARRHRPGHLFVDVAPAATFDHVAVVGAFNLADGWSKAETWATLERLWAQTRKTLAVSLYRGNDTRCIRYLPSEIAQFANAKADSWALDYGYLPNDMLMVLRR